MTKVTDHQVATVRALLEGDKEEHLRLRNQLEDDEYRQGYSALLFSAFFDTLDRRFGKTATDADIIQYVADIRARSDDVEAALDPQIAERVIRNVLRLEPTDGISDSVVVEYQVILLGLLVVDEGFDGAQLDGFLRRARAYADHMLST